MNIERAVMAFAGAMVLISLALGIYFNQNWLWVTAFFGANLFQASFTGFCPMAMILKKLGAKQGPVF